jgi:hypothetical protein
MFYIRLQVPQEPRVNHSVILRVSDQVNLGLGQLGVDALEYLELNVTAIAVRSRGTIPSTSFCSAPPALLT